MPDQKHQFDFYFGVAYFSLKKFEDALKYFKLSSEKLPGKSEYYMGHLARKQKKLKEAEAHYLKAYELLKDPEVISSLADLYYSDKKLEKAIKYYKKAISFKPKSYIDRYWLANIYFQKRQFKKSEELLKKVLEINPQFRKAYVGLYGIADQRKDKVKSLYYQCRALLLRQSYDKVGSLLEKNKKITFKDLNLTKFYLVSLFKSGVLERAKRTLKVALKLFPKDADLLMYRGIIIHSNGEVDKAIKYFRKLLKRFPKNFNILVALGDILKREKKIDEAIKLFEKALLVSESNTSYRYTLSELYRKKGDYQKELYHRGILFLYQSQVTEALEALVRVEKPIYKELYHFYLAKVYALKNNFEQAKKNYNKSISFRKKFVKAYLELAYLYVKENQNQKAINVLNSYPGNHKEILSLKKFILKM